MIYVSSVKLLVGSPRISTLKKGIRKDVRSKYKPEEEWSEAQEKVLGSGLGRSFLT